MTPAALDGLQGVVWWWGTTGKPTLYEGYPNGLWFQACHCIHAGGVRVKKSGALMSNRKANNHPNH